MKARPRWAENRIAEELNKSFSHLKVTPFERIPVLGRAGPDLTINELGLAIDVKSRQVCPKSAFMNEKHWAYISHKDRKGGLIAIRVSDIGMAVEYKEPVCLITESDWHTTNVTAGKQIIDWWLHMDEWTAYWEPEKISAIVIHRPGMPYGSSMLIMKSKGFQQLYQTVANIKETK